MFARRLTLGNISPFHKAFIVAATAAAGMNFVVQPIATRVQNRKDETLARFSLKEKDVAALAGTDAIYVKNPEDASFLLLAATEFSADRLRTAWNYNTAGHDDRHVLYSFNDKRTMLGRGQPLDSLTLGLSGAIYPNAVIVPSARATADEVLRSFTGRGAAQGYHLPPSLLKELEKIIFLHEIAHSAQRGDNVGNELDADTRALDFYMNHGGDADAARVFISLRAMNELGGAFYGLDPDNRYASAPLLDHRFFDGPYMDFGQSRQAFAQAATALRGAAATGAYGSTDPYVIAARMADDENAVLPPPARQVLRLCADGYDFFTRAAGPQLSARTFTPAPAAN